MRTRRFVAVAVSFGLLLAPAAAQDDRLVIVIDTFENPANYRSSTIGNALTDMFITSLSRAGTFTVMDGRGGDSIDADLYLGAKITNFSYQEERVAASDRSFFSLRDSSSARTWRQTMNVRIDITAVDPSQEILFAEAVAHSETNTSESTRAGDYDRLVSSSVSVREMTGSMMGRATEAAIDKAVERLTTYFDIVGPGVAAVEASVVALVDPTIAVINRGRSAGLQAGDALAVLRDEPITNAAGEVVFSRQVTVGSATVSELQEDGALIAVPAGVEIREGDVVVRGASGGSTAEHLGKADAFFDEGFYWATIREYRSATDIDPAAAVDDFRLGVAHLMSDDLNAAAQSLGAFIADGGTLEWDATHRHTFGSCSGTFVVSDGVAAFRSPDEDDPDHRFQVPLTAIRQARQRDREMMQGSEEVLLPFVEFRAASAEQATKNEGDTKNWSFHFDFMEQHDAPADLLMRFISAR